MNARNNARVRFKKLSRDSALRVGVTLSSTAPSTCSTQTWNFVNCAAAGSFHTQEVNGVLKHKYGFHCFIRAT